MNIRQIIDRFKKQATPNVNMLADLAELQKRNAKRIESIKQEMGNKWLHHPDNMKQRLNEPRPV